MRFFKLLILIFLFNRLFAQDNNLDFVIDFITTKEGLSHNYVSSIISDDLNIKWIGTENGITKYNGYDFDFIKPDKENSEILNENIEVLFKDKSNNIWIGTKSGGISYLNPRKNKIKNLNHLIDVENKGDIRVISLAEDDYGNIWIGTSDKGVFVIDYQEEKLLKQFVSLSQVYCIIKDFQGNMWFDLNRNLAKYNIAQDKIDIYQFENYITDILADTFRQKIWISSGGKADTKLYSYSYETNKFDTIETNIVSEFTKKMLLDNHNRLWIGTWGGGVFRSNDDITKFDKLNLLSGRTDKAISSYSNLLNIHQDKNNIIWLATVNGGVVRIVEANGFQNADKIINEPEWKSDLNVTSIYKNENYIFVGTVFKGVFYGKDISSLKQIKAIGNVRINSFYGFDGKLYIGTNDGFYIFDLKNEKIIFSSDFPQKVTSFLIVNNKDILIGTQEQGLAIVGLDSLEHESSYKIYVKSYKNTKNIKNNRITGIQQDQSNNIWISTYNGIHLFDKDKKTFLHQSDLMKEKLPSTIINSISIQGNVIWAATPSGLFALKLERQKLTLVDAVTKENGLNSDFICAVTFDKDSSIWFSTYTEIVKYNSIDKTIISYTDINGVKVISFNKGSFFNYNNQEIFFGGIDNIIFFNPSTLGNIRTVPEIIFTNLRIDNKRIDFNEESKILDNNINYANQIRLNHKENSFSLSFVANDFFGKLNIYYRYQLKGQNNAWINLQNRNEINFVGLGPGNYTLNVQTSRDKQNWSKIKSIKITLLPSPWKSPWALFSYFLLFSLIAAYFISVNQRALKLQNNLEIARIEKEKEKEIAEAKLNFFTNISHEFRTPLTLIISPIKELLQDEKLSSDVFEKLTLIDKNTNRLLNLVNQLLDFRKADHGLLKLDASYGNFVKFSSEVFLYFRETAYLKNINYIFNPVFQEIRFPFDRDKMEIVLCNLLSNSFKYTNSGGNIQMDIDRNEEFCIIKIKDTGIGMDEENLEKIFDKFFQIKSGNTARMIGSGVGLYFSKQIIDLHHGSIQVKSEKNVGTEFLIQLSLDPALYGDDLNLNFMTTDNINAYTLNDDITKEEDFQINDKQYTILLIDDNADILRYLESILRNSYNVICVENGNLGFEVASTEVPDLIISDVMMPGKDGITLCKELKNQFITSHIPVILLTARTSTVFEIEGLKTGADDYITKPFNAGIVKARILSLLQNREKLKTHLLNKIRFEPFTSEPKIENDAENAFIEKAIHIVEKNLDNPDFGIENLVNELFMSQSTLFRKIKSLTGLSLTGFIRSIRLKKAAQLILTTDYSMNQIAYEVGFNDYKYFKKSFKTQFNCLPSEYKEQHTNQQN